MVVQQSNTKTAVVTGAARGIGRAIVEELLKHSYRVFLLDIDEKVLVEVAHRLTKSGDVIALVCDVSSEANVKKIVDEVLNRHGSLDLLVNNAAIANPDNGPLENLSLEQWNARLAVNLTGAFLCSREFLPLLKASLGTIVNISSTRALMSEPNTEAYAASKGGLDAFTHALAISVGPEVRVNGIRPGWIDTDDESNQISREAHTQHPVGRVGIPLDVAQAVRFLASAEAAFITGQILTVDGGMTRKMIYKD